MSTEGARRHWRRQRLRNRDFAGVAKLLRAADPDRAAFYDTLAAALPADTVPDYFGLVASAKNAEQADGFRFASIDDALAHGLTVHAFELAAAPPTTPSQLVRWERRLLAVLKRCFLDAGPDGTLLVGIPCILEATHALASRLAGDPFNNHLRTRLVELLRTNIAGTTGLALIAKLVLDAASVPIVFDRTIQDCAWPVHSCGAKRGYGDSSQKQ